MASSTAPCSPQYPQHAQHAGHAVTAAAVPPSHWGVQASSSPVGGSAVNGGDGFDPESGGVFGMHAHASNRPRDGCDPESGAAFDPESGGAYGMHAPTDSFGGDPESDPFASEPSGFAIDIEGGTAGYSAPVVADARGDPNLAALGFGDRVDGGSHAANAEGSGFHPHTDSAAFPMNTTGNANSSSFLRAAPTETAVDPEAAGARSGADNAVASGLEGSWPEAGVVNDAAATEQQQRRWAEQQQQQSSAAGEEPPIDYSVRLVSSFWLYSTGCTLLASVLRAVLCNREAHSMSGLASRFRLDGFSQAVVHQVVQFEMACV